MHCYVYRGDARREVDSTVVTQTKSFDVPIRRKRNGEYKIPSGSIPVSLPISLSATPMNGVPMPGR